MGLNEILYCAIEGVLDHEIKTLKRSVRKIKPKEELIEFSFRQGLVFGMVRAKRLIGTLLENENPNDSNIDDEKKAGFSGQVKKRL